MFGVRCFVLGVRCFVFADWCFVRCWFAPCWLFVVCCLLVFGLRFWCPVCVVCASLSVARCVLFVHCGLCVVCFVVCDVG